MLIFWGSFGATAFFLIWLNFVRFWPFTKQTASSQDAAELGLSMPWLVIGFVALILFVGVLGPGIGQLPLQILDEAKVYHFLFDTVFALPSPPRS